MTSDLAFEGCLNSVSKLIHTRIKKHEGKLLTFDTRPCMWPKAETDNQRAFIFQANIFRLHLWFISLLHL